VGYSWTLYAEATSDRALAAVEATYDGLEALIGPDALRAYEDDDTYPEELGAWPRLEARTGPVPSPAEERARLEEPNKIGVRFEEAALDRLGRCRCRIDIDRPGDFKTDPTLVSAVRTLIELVGPSVFCENRGFDLVTSETLLASLEKMRGLEAALADEEPGEPASEEVKASTIHRVLATMATNPKMRRAAMQLLEEADPEVAKVAAVIAQRGPADDERLALWTGLSEADVEDARYILADLLSRAQTTS
jgi:hypothetical protein